MICTREVSLRKALFVGIQYRNERHFRQVKPFTQKIDADQHIKLTQAQVPDNFHALYGADIVVHIAYADTRLCEVQGEILRHFLRECRDEGSPCRAVRLLISPMRSSICPSTGRTKIFGSTRPVGRIICSTTWEERILSYSPGVALT